MGNIFKNRIVPLLIMLQMILSPLQTFSYDEDKARRDSTGYNWKTGEEHTGFYFKTEDINFLSDLYRIFEARLLTNREFLKSVLWCINNPELAQKNPETFSLCDSYLKNMQLDINTAFSEMRVNLALSKMTFFQNELIKIDPKTGISFPTNSTGVDPTYEHPINVDDELPYFGKIKFLFYEENGVVKNRLHKTFNPQHNYGISLFTDQQSKLATLSPLTQSEMKLAHEKLKSMERNAFLCAYGEISACPVELPKHLQQILKLRKEYLKRPNKRSAHEIKILMQGNTNQLKYSVAQYVYDYYSSSKKSLFEENYKKILSSIPTIGFIAKPVTGNPWTNPDLKRALTEVLKNNNEVSSDFQKFFDKEDFDKLLVLTTYQPVVDSLLYLITTEAEEKLNSAKSEGERKEIESNRDREIEAIKKIHAKLLSELKTRKFIKDNVFFIGVGLLALPCAAIGNVFGAAACGAGLGAVASYGQFRYSRFFYDKEFSDFFSSDRGMDALVEISELDARQTEMVFAYIFLGIVPGSLNFLKVFSKPTAQTIVNFSTAVKTSVKRTAL